MAKSTKKNWKSSSLRLAKSVWLFPLICTFILILLTAFKISGTSIGVYDNYFFGTTSHDSSLLLNKPRDIRSDEWLVNTQMTIAQSNNGFHRINKNVGQGEDTSIVLDVPYKEWSELFKPQNWSFFVLPFEFALAFKWWFMGYLLVLSVYFFVLALLPKKRLLASLLSLAVFFSPFIQWWYQYITLGPIYYSLLIGTLFIYLLRSRARVGYWKAGLLAYLIASFALVLYPPFQIPCALVILFFAVGYALSQYQKSSVKELLNRLLLVFGALVVAGALSLTFLETRHGVVKSIEDTVYPGHRLTQTGGADAADVFSGNLDFQLQFSSKAAKYVSGHRGITNQSESSNFILLLPFLAVPAWYLVWRGYKARDKNIWPLAAINFLFLIFLLDLFAPHLNLPLGLIGLIRVPHERLLIGLGLLNSLQVILVILAMTKSKWQPKKSLVFGYSIVVLITELGLGYYTKHHSPGFIGDYRLLLFSVPIPASVYLLLRRKNEWAICIIVLFSLMMSIGINPLYRGTDVLTNTALSNDVKKLNEQTGGKWISEGIYLENLPSMNGAPSLSGIYAYPQLSQWSSIDHGTQQFIYNRYAHVGFKVDRNSVPDYTSLELAGPDHFDVTTTPCSNFLKMNHVRFILTQTPIDNTCAKLTHQINYPAKTLLIYKLSYSS